MGNMSHCKFENTYNNLQDCYKVIANDKELLSKSEEKYKQKLVQLCCDIAADFIEEEDEN